MESKKIYESMAAIMAGVGAIDKSQKNQTQGFMYRGIDDFMNELHKLFADNKVILLPRELDHIQEQYTTAKGALQFHSRVHVEFNFVSLIDGSQLTADGWGEAADSADKGYNKCKSIALKYVLMQTFLVPLKDIADPDAETPEQVQSKPIEDPNLDLIMQQIKEARNLDDLGEIWRGWPAYQNDMKQAWLAKRKLLGV